MALNYSVALRPNPLKKDEPAKAYATAQVNGRDTVDIYDKVYYDREYILETFSTKEQ